VNSELPEMHINPAAHRPLTFPALRNNQTQNLIKLIKFSFHSEKKMGCIYTNNTIVQRFGVSKIILEKKNLLFIEDALI